MSKKTEYVIAGPEGTRTSSDPGGAKVMGGGGKTSSQPSSFGDLAYTAGGGALGYLLSKWIMGDDDDEKGKKKGGSLLRSIVPWLSAAAGAYGGHVLSGAGSTDKGRPGEFAFKKNEDGTIEIPKKPQSGGNSHRVGNVALGTSAVTGARSAANYIYHRPEILRDKALRLRNAPHQTRKTIELARKFTSKANEIEAKRIARNGFLRGTGSLVGGDLPKGPRWAKALTGWKGSLATSLASLGLSGGAHWLGSNMNENRREWKRALQALGASEGD